MGASSKKVLFLGVALAIVVVGVITFLVFKKSVPEPVKVQEPQGLKVEKGIIGKSVEGRDIESFTFVQEGAPDKHLVFVGGIHGGYEWNSVLLAYRVMDYIEKNPDFVPAGFSLTIIPSANPDAVSKVAGKEGRFAAADVSEDEELLASARFNANKVDLNRNFDCDWKPEATWRSKKVSAGSEAFSEPESKALQQFFLKTMPDAVVFWHSQANAVYPGDCKGEFLPETHELMDVYAKASGYSAQKTFDSYAVNGAADGWLTTIGIPTLTVELKTHETIEFEQNLSGLRALLRYYSGN